MTIEHRDLNEDTYMLSNQIQTASSKDISNHGRGIQHSPCACGQTVKVVVGMESYRSSSNLSGGPIGRRTDDWTASSTPTPTHCPFTFTCMPTSSNPVPSSILKLYCTFFLYVDMDYLYTAFLLLSLLYRCSFKALIVHTGSKST